MGDLFLWQKNLLHSIGTRPVVILHGNIRDLYVYRDPSLLYESSLDEVLVRLLSPRYGPLLRYDPYAKAAELSLGAADALAIKALPDYGAPGFNVTTDPTIARVLGDLETAGQRRLWYFKYMHNMLPYRSSYSQEEGLRLIAFQRIAENIAPDNRLILSYLSDSQVPVELSQNAHRVALVKVPLPDFAERSAFWTSRLAGNERLASDLAKLTDGMALSSLATLAQLARETREIPDLSLSDWEREIAHFKFGDRQNYYDQIRLEDLEKAEEFFTVQEGIQGQSHAVEKAVQMLWKARTNVGALLRTEASGAPPRGVLFCCGPSGTGKTMLGKKLAKFVFGTETAFYRIDMSEFQQDHTVSKLIGAPPGYVGFEMGGTLTNAVLERPFSVLLFDEIEKAHPRIFDLFLQILSDGRLTDSRGQTVFFSEAIILFTSNLGTRKDEIAQLQAARASGDPERVRKHFVQCVQDFFRLEISRPELLNRIGNNIVPFNFLDDEKIAVSALRLYLCKMQSRFDEEHGPRKLRLEIDFDQVAGLLAARHGKEISEFGGKAVLNTLDTVILPELARCLLELEMRPRPAGATIRISAPPGLGRVEVAVGGPSRGGTAG